MVHPPRFTLAGLLLGYLIFVVPSEANTCRTGCHGIHTSKAYQEGRTYTYQLEGETVTSVSEAEGETTLKLNAIVELAVKPDCVHQVKLKNLQINGSPASQGEVEAHALQFNYHNGHIDTEVCAEPGDSHAALNIKRAVISLFQYAVVQDEGSATHFETDVFGGCPTDFKFSKNGESRVIQKYRNLEQCSYRENIKQDLVSATFNLNSNVKSVPLLAAEQKVEQRFERGVLNQAVSVETYKYKPFSSGDAGAKTVVKTTLTYKGESGAGRTASVSEPKSLIFEAPHQVVRSSVDAINRALLTAKESMPDAVTLFSARRFAELIKVLRQSSKNDILTVYASIKGGAEKDSIRKVLLDALFRTGTGETAEAIVDLVKRREITPIETYVYYTSLAFIRHASLSSVTAVTSLLNEPNLPRIAYLGIGSLIGKYCQEHNCENVPEINAALAKISSKLTKATTRQQEDSVIAALKGLGNTRYLDDATLIKIAKIANDKSVHNRVRVAALEALPTKCSMTWKELIFPTLADRAEDSEIRIKAYLSLVRCPCSHVANELKEVLDKETVNQVGSFITSHLRNLRASTNPDKQKAKHQLGLIKPRTKFPEDFRKFSYNNELSYIIDAFGIGTSVESNVIYSQNSFVPRSASINFTTEIFGHSFNFLEFDGRVENLDRLIEQYLGPKGTLQPSDLKEVFVDGRKTYEQIYEKIQDRFNKKLGRHARDTHVTQKQIESFARKVHLPDTELNDDLELDLSIKMFGVELAFLSLAGSDNQLNANNIVDQILNVIEASVDKAKHFDYHFKNHLQFLDAELVYPTGLGFPLTLGVTGTSAVHLKTSGKIDLTAIIKNPQSTSVQIGLEPSASIRIAGSLIVEGYGIESGLKIITTLHTATATDVTVKLLEGNGVDINVGVPKPKQELITVTSEVLLSSGAKGDNYVSPKFSKGKEHADCFDQLSVAIGFSVCGKISYPYDSLASIQKKPLFPLSGPASFSAYIEHYDARNYHFRAFLNAKNPNARSFEILLETPNSRTDRRISLLVEAALEPEKLIKLEFDSPFKKASLIGIVKNNQNEQTLSLTFKHDSIEYFVRTGITASGRKYRPVLEYKIPDHVEQLAGIKNGAKTSHRNGQQYVVGGIIDVSDYNGGKKYVLDKVLLASGGQTLISIDGTVAGFSRGGNADLTIEYGGDRYAFKGNTELSTAFNYKTDISVVPSKNKEHGFSVFVETKGNPHDNEQTLIIVHGSDLNSQTNRITYHGKQNVKYVSPQDFDVSVERKLTYPVLNLLVLLEGRINPKLIDYDVEFKYGKFNLESEFSAKTGIQKPGDFEIDFEAKLLTNSIEFKTERVILGDHKNKFTTSLELEPGGKYEIDAVVEYDVKPENINTQLKAELKVDRKKITFDLGLKVNPNRVDSHAIVIAENTKYIDFLLALQRGTSPNGNLKLNLKNYLTADGDFRYQRGAGNAQIDINIPKFNRKITGQGEVSVVGSKHVATVDILYDASKDPRKRIKLRTDTDLTQTSLDTKNTIEILDYKTTINAKGAIQGQIDNGRFNADFDITLPNGRYIVGKGSRVVSTQNGLMNGDIEVELVDHVTKGGKSRKFSFHAHVQNLNVKAFTFESKQDLKLKNFDGDEINFVSEWKNLPNGPDKKSATVKFDLTGSKIPSPFSLQVDYDYENDGASSSGTVQSSLGSNLSLKANGNFVRGNNIDKPCTAESVIEIRLPSNKLKNIKFEISESILIPRESGGSRFEYIARKHLTYNDDQTIKFDSHLANFGIPDKTSSIEGTGKVTVTVLKNPPLTVGYNYKYNPTNELKEAGGGMYLNYGNKQTSIAYDTTFREKFDFFTLNIKAVTPIEKLHNLDVKLQHQGSPVDGPASIPRSGKTEVTVIVNQVKYTLSSEVEFTGKKFHSHMIFNSPEGKTEKIVKFNVLGENEFTAEWKYISPKVFIEVDGHVNVESLDVFSIIFNIDSDQFKTRKIHGEIANKPVKGGKRIQISITSEGKNIITGSTNYKKSVEDNKIIVEGSGSLRISESTKSSSFKYTRQILIAEVDGENGVTTLLNFNYGEFSVVGECKSTNKEFYFLNTYCEKNSDCAQIKLQFKINSEVSKRSEDVTIEVDLRKFKIPFEFGVKSTQVFDARTGFDNKASLYLHSSKANTQYSYQIYGHPTESGIIVTLPSREIALIGSAEIPKNRRSGAYKIDVSFYLDRKGHPKEKTSFIVTGDVVLDKNSGYIIGESKFTYPSQTKDLSVKGKVNFGGAHLLNANLDIDIFATKNQKIAVVAKLIKTPINQGFNVTGDLSITSPGQQLYINVDQHLAVSRNEIGFGSLLSYTDEHRKQKSAAILFAANLQEAHFLINSPDQQLLQADSRIDLAKNSQKVQTDVVIFGRDPIVVTLEVKDLNSFKYLYKLKNNPNNRFEASGRIVVGELAQIEANSFKNGRENELFHILIRLDERNYLKPDIAFNKENIGQFLDAYRARVTEIAELVNQFIKTLTEEIVTELKDFLEHLKKARPNLKPLIDRYTAEFNKLKDELTNGVEGFKQIQEKINAIFGPPITAIVEAIKRVYEHSEELRKQFSDVLDRVQEAIKSTLPELQKSSRAILAALTEIADSVLTLLTTYVKTLIDIFNTHKDEFKQIAALASELTRDIVSIIWKATTKIQTEIKDFFTVLVAEVKALPIYEFAQQKYKQLIESNVSNAIISVINELGRSINRFLPTEALREFFTSVQDYIIAHLRGEKINDVQELKKLYGFAIEAIQSIIELLRSHGSTNYLINILETRVPFDFTGLSKLPGISTLKISTLALLRNREWPTLSDFFYAYRPTLHSSDVIPPFSKFGIFVDGGHFFTFDGRHLTIPGKCNYVLAQDARDGNFSIVGEFNEGKLASITITEPTDTITIQSNGAILVNNRAAEFPASTKNLHAFVNPTSIRILSDYGVNLHCNRKTPFLCTVHVSGFYHGKLRGLLGNGNNEPWDDFTLPSGKVSESESEFANSFKINSGCPNVQTVDHHASHHHDAVCTEFFTGQSSLSSCFNYVNPTAYRQACDHAVSAGARKEGPCLIAAAYYTACREARIFLNIPTSCGSCQVGNRKVDVGDSFSVQHPKQQADIIFVVEQANENSKIFHELVIPLISVVKSELKDNGITDVHIGLIGFGDHLVYPQHFTYKGSLNIEGDVKGIKFAERTHTITLQEAKSGDLKKKLEFIIQKLAIELGLFKLTTAYEEALSYDFRPGASKTIVGVIATPCEKSALPISLQQLRLLLGYKAYRDLGLTYHQIGDLSDILVSGKPAKNVVGFDSDSGFIFADSKKRPVEGSTDLRNKMVVSSNDVCAEFAASSGGAAFSAHNFLAAKDNQQKQFLQVAGRRLAGSLINTEIKEDCVCRQQFGIYPRAECKIVSRKEKEPVAKRTKGGIKG